MPFGFLCFHLRSVQHEPLIQNLSFAVRFHRWIQSVFFSSVLNYHIIIVEFSIFSFIHCFHNLSVNFYLLQKIKESECAGERGFRAVENCSLNCPVQFGV
ncbi:Hypothetical_protein [Hexamita inflata]|uniref:Hypothetical_protein n=1 Tax=Hexamita inflata TaxID=28002 RepID=A0AA86NTL0_9EUKA|nr:Hypothetical protein HINF_LOCUS12206 [Hexamita inflata]